MKILVVNNMVPFLSGGAEHLAKSLVRHLARFGHDAELLRIPFRWDPAERIYDELLACRMMRLYNVDRVIGLKFPAYLIPHPDKTIWLVHQYRQAYDLAETPYTNIPGDSGGEALRKCIRSADNECFQTTNDVYTISRVVKERLAKHNQIDGTVLHPPLDDAERFQPIARENYVFCGGRINACKRQHLLIEAMAHCHRDVHLVVAGPPDTPADQKRLEELVKRHRLHDRVALHFGYHDRDKLVAWVNRAMACAYVPYDEDYGYVTLEAFYAGKAVLTTDESGGVLDFVTDRETGRVTSADPLSLAAALDELTQLPRQTQQWGEAAREKIQQCQITWPETVKRLVA